MKYILPSLGAVAATALFTFSAVSISADAKETQSKNGAYEQFDLFSDVIGRVQLGYVVDVEYSELMEGALDGMLQNLDPHSSYLNAEEYERLQSNMAGEYGGLGMEVTSDRGVVRVVSPIDDSPAKEAGIKAGDFITEIEGESIIGLPLDEAVERMRGKAGVPITITVIRGEEDPMEFDLVRDKIVSKPTKYEIKDGFGYIRIPQFNEKTFETLETAVKDMKKDFRGDIPGVILDLRSNPGGSLGASISVSSAFLNGGEVVSTRGRTPEKNQSYTAQKGELFKGVPVIVLIDGASASASEIVAGAIQDRRRGLVIGMTSFGKGSVQEIIALKGGRQGAIRMTTQKYYTPAGRSIQGTGITPDIAISAVPENEAEGLRISESDLPNSIQNELETTEEEAAIVVDYPPEGFDEEGDYQLDRAIQILKDGTYSEKLAELADN